MVFEPLKPRDGIVVFKDPGDRLIPKGTNYIDDFVLVTKGMATPTRMCIWAALSQVSAALKRDAWISWYPGCFYGNVYVVLIGPPRWNAKSTIIDDYTDPILRGYVKHLPPELVARKTPQVFRSKTTPEGLFYALTQPTKVYTKSPDGKDIEVTIPWSNAVLLLSELGTFLGKQKYNEGLIQKLTDLYSCKAEDDETTKGGGTIKTRDTYVSLLGASTPAALEACLPESAFTDGFLSRLIIVKGEGILRKWEVPYEVVPGAATYDGGHVEFPPLERRLAWIASTFRGEFTFSEEALAAHQQTNLALMEWSEQARDENEIAIRSRMDLNILKVALLVRCSRYEPGFEITLDDYNHAKVIVEDTYRDSFSVIANVGAPQESKQIESLREYLKYKGKVERQDVVRRFSSKHGKLGIPSRQLTLLLAQLQQEGMIKVYYNDKLTDRILEKTHEVYEWGER